MSPSGAMAEASLLIKKGQVWVHEICAPRQRPEIASIVAVTRTSDTVAGITKVYTNPRWRQRGCAERLVRHVCRECVYSQCIWVVASYSRFHAGCSVGRRALFYMWLTTILLPRRSTIELASLDCLKTRNLSKASSPGWSSALTRKRSISATGSHIASALIRILSISNISQLQSASVPSLIHL